MKDNKQSSRFFDIKPRSFVKFSTNVIDRIFSEFSFRTLNKKSSTNLIYKNIINTAFGASIIQSIMVDEKKVKYCINADFIDLLPKIENLCTNHSRKNIDSVNGKAQIACEDEDQEE